MSLLGATTGGDDPHDRARRQGVHAARVRVLARSRAPVRSKCAARVDGRRLSLEVKTPSGTRTRSPRARGAAGAVAEHLAAPRQRRPGRRRAAISGPCSIRRRCATRRSTSRSAGASWCAAPAPRRCRRSASRWSSPGLKTTSWITDTGEVVREESPLGLITVRESAESAQSDGGVAADAGRSAPGRGGGARG